MATLDTSKVLNIGVINPSRFSKVKLFVVEVLVKEIFSILKYVYYSIWYFLKPHQYNLDPSSLIKQGDTAKIVILIPGQGAGPACFLPLAKKLQEAGVQNVYTIKYEPPAQNPLPLELLKERIRKIAQGVSKVEVELIGHSLGGSMAFRLAFMDQQGGLNGQGIHISQIISIAGRLKFIPEDSWNWYCPKLGAELVQAMRDYTIRKDQTDLFTIRGTRDAMIPEVSVHVGEQKYNAENRRHFEVIFAPEVHEVIATLTRTWVEKPQMRSAVNL